VKYLLLIHGDEQTWDQTCRQDTCQLAHRLQETGQLVGGAALQSAAQSRCVRVRADKRLVTDGPFAETREQIGGFFMVEAHSPEEAADLAAQIPGARVGAIEVRPIVEGTLFQ
jgi:hypothetical protein